MNTKRKPRASRARANLRAAAPELRPHIVKMSFPYLKDGEWLEGELVASVNLPVGGPMRREQVAIAVRPMAAGLRAEGVDDVYVDWICEVPDHDSALWTIDTAHSPLGAVHYLGDEPDEGVIPPLLSLTSSAAAS